MIPGFSLGGIARALGGEVCGGQALVPGLGHSPRDRSLSIRLSPSAPGGFIVHSHAGDDWQVCRNYACERLGLATANSRWLDPPRRAATDRATIADAAAKAAGTRQALALWREGVNPRGTVAERYLNARALTLDNDLARDVLRWHPRIGAMLALFRNVLTGEPQAISRTFLDREGKKLGRKFLGPALGAAVMLDPFDFVTTGLHVGDGGAAIQPSSCLGTRQRRCRRGIPDLGRRHSEPSSPIKRQMSAQRTQASEGVDNEEFPIDPLENSIRRLRPRWCRDADWRNAQELTLLRRAAMYMPNFLDGFDRLVAFDAETTGKRTPDAEFIRKQPFAWKAPGIIIEVGFVEMLREGAGWRKGETWSSRVNPDGPIDPEAMKVHGIRSVDLENAPRFPTILPKVKDFVGESPIVAHAYKNERDFLDYEFARA